LDQPRAYVIIKALLSGDAEIHSFFGDSSIDELGLTYMYPALKWGTHTALQLSAEEVLQLADLLGFDVDYTSRKSIESLYVEQPETLLKFTYGECLLFPCEE
jgi:hypothetical protein